MSPDVDVWRKRSEPEELPEWMDEPCSFAQFRDCVRDLEQVNRWTLGYRPTLDFLESVVRGREAAGPLRILDVGFGRGDGLRRVARWARSQGVAVALTGVDINPFAERAAQEVAAGEAIRWVTGDYRDLAEPFDVVMSSLVAHHLSSAQVVAFVGWMEARAERGWFVNDLERSPRAAAAFSLLAKVARWHAFVRHDGPVSFRRAFRREDWRRLVGAAGVAVEDVTIEAWRPGRLCVGRLR